MSNIIIPGDHNIGTRGYVPTASGYDAAADDLVRLHNEGRSINTSDPEIRRVLEYHGVSNMNELQTKRRGW